MLQRLCFLLMVFIFATSAKSNFKPVDRRPLYGADEITPQRPTCPIYRDGSKMVPCPSPDSNDSTNWPCIRYADLCNHSIDCPNGEDESENMCFYHSFRRDQIHELRRAVNKLRS